MRLIVYYQVTEDWGIMAAFVAYRWCAVSRIFGSRLFLDCCSFLFEGLPFVFAFGASVGVFKDYVSSGRGR